MLFAGPRIVVLIVVCVYSVLSQASTLNLPIPDTTNPAPRAPAIDLIFQGNPIDRDQAIDLIYQNIDISTLDPIDSDDWKSQGMKASTLDPEGRNLPWPPAGGTLNYEAPLTSTGDRIYQARLTNSEGQVFRLLMSTDVHAALLTAELLKKLGYVIPMPHYYERLKIRFSTVAARDSFINELGTATQAKVARWVVEAPEKIPEVVVRDLVLEPFRSLLPNYHWGTFSQDPFQGRRAVRALIVPIVMMDVFEYVSSWGWEMGQFLGSFISLVHPYAHKFEGDGAAYEDARWIARKIARLTKDDFEQVLRAAHYPAPVEKLLREKIASRRNSMVRLFNLASELPESEREWKFNPKISEGDTLQDGRILKETFEDCAVQYRDSEREPKPPLRRDEVTRFLEIEGISNGIRALTTKINEYLQIQGPSDVAKAHQEKLMQEVISHYQKNPNQPFAQRIKTWAGVTGGFAIQANRNLLTGTYFGSDAPIQLVDSIGVQASIGFFMGMDGVTKVVPSAGGNLFVSRNYVHVRPMLDAKQALKTSWKWLWVPGFMNHLSKLLAPEAASGADPLDPKNSKVLTDILNNVFDEFKEGEVFTITDSVGLGAAANLAIPITSFVAADPIGLVSPTLNFSASGQAVIVRRTMITRTKEGFQVYVQALNTESITGSAEVSIWIKLFKDSYALQRGGAATRAYLIGNLPAEPTEKNPETPEDLAKKQKMYSSLKTLFKGNTTEVLESHFPPYHLEHEVNSKIHRGHFLRWYWSGVDESHRAVIQPPADPEKKFNPEDFKRTLYSYRLLRRSGTNDYAFLSDIVDALTSGYGFNTTNAAVGNPANSFLGKSKWTSTQTEAEITSGREIELVSFVEHHWQGWVLPKDKLFKIFDGIESKVSSIRPEVPLFDRAKFNSMKQLQMYDISTTLFVYERGVRKITQELTQKQKQSDFILYKHLIEIEGVESFKNWCRSEMRRKISSENETEVDVERKVNEILNDRGWMYDCMKPWMYKVFSLLKQQEKETLTPETRIKWTAQLVQALEGGVEFTRLAQWLGDKNYFFQARISGFRKNQEDGDQAYISQSLGTFDQEVDVGPFKKFSNDFKIISYELNARYLGDGG